MNRGAVWLGLMAWFAWCSVAWALEGTVRLKNGGFIHGDILEHLPGERVSVRTSDGSVRSVPWDEVERVEEASAPAAQPPASVSSEPAPDPSHERFDDVTLTLFGVLGVVGNAAVDAEATITSSSGTARESDSDDVDLELSYGGGAQLDIPLHRFFSLAPQLRLTSWRPDVGGADDRRALFIDVLVAPRVRLPFMLGPGALGVVYLQVPVGLSYIDFPSSQTDLRVSPALTFGVSAGFLALLSEHVGIALDLGWLLRSFGADYEEEEQLLLGEVVTIEYESDWTVTQVALQLGLVVAF